MQSNACGLACVESKSSEYNSTDKNQLATTLPISTHPARGWLWKSMAHSTMSQRKPNTTCAAQITLSRWD